MSGFFSDCCVSSFVSRLAYIRLGYKCGNGIDRVCCCRFWLVKICDLLVGKVCVISWLVKMCDLLVGKVCVIYLVGKVCVISWLVKYV